MHLPRFAVPHYVAAFLGMTATATLMATVSSLAADAPPRRARPPAILSPEILEDGKVTFRLQASKASEVVVVGQIPGGRAPMVRGSNDVWTATVGPVQPGVYEYSFAVDGLNMIDPGNTAIKPMRQPRSSILHVVGDPPLIHDFRDVPHGVVRLHAYLSKSLGRQRDFVVYTPPGYDDQTSVRYPVLYLQHGSGDNHLTWTAHGKAHWILDNLIAEKKAAPMIVVMMDGHAAPRSADRQGNTTAFETDLLETVLPWVERNYRVRADSANRAIAGLSMGGEQALRIGLNHLDQFAWVAGFSAAAPSEEALAKVLNAPEAANAKLKLLWIACGKDDFLLQRNEDLVALLKGKDIRHEWRLTEGDHSWPVWRIYLADLAPQLFRGAGL